MKNYRKFPFVVDFSKAFARLIIYFSFHTFNRIFVFYFNFYEI